MYCGHKLRSHAHTDCQAAVDAAALLFAPQGFENASSREVLHQAYAFLTGPSANPQDLRMTLGDIRSGLQQEARKAVTSLAATPLPAPAGTSVTRAAATAPTSCGARPLWLRQQRASSSEGGVADAAAETPFSRFTVPLGRVAAFLRTAQLVPPLLSKYIQQLTKQGEDAQKYGRAAALPVMPLLRVDISKRPDTNSSTSPSQPLPMLEASAPGTAASGATSATAADALSSSASSLSLGSRRMRAMTRQSSSGLGSPSNRASLSPGPGQSAGSPSLALLGSFTARASGTAQPGRQTLGISSSFGGGSRRWSSDVGVKSLTKRARKGGKAEPVLLTAGQVEQAGALHCPMTMGVLCAV